MDNFEEFIQNEYDKYDKFINVDRNDEEFTKHFNKYNWFDFKETIKTELNKPGQIFLFEIYNHEHKTISYPKIGIFLNYLPCDQTLEIEWATWRRTWEYNRKYKSKDYQGIEREYDFSDLQSYYFYRSLPQWMDYHLIYGVWDTLPDWKTLKRHYETTWWFHRPVEEVRDIKIDFLLK